MLKIQIDVVVGQFIIHMKVSAIQIAKLLTKLDALDYGHMLTKTKKKKEHMVTC